MLQEGNHVRPLAASLLPTYSVNHSFSPYSGLGSPPTPSLSQRGVLFFSLGSPSSNAEFVVANCPSSPYSGWGSSSSHAKLFSRFQLVGLSLRTQRDENLIFQERMTHKPVGQARAAGTSLANKLVWLARQTAWPGCMAWLPGLEGWPAWRNKLGQ